MEEAKISELEKKMAGTQEPQGSLLQKERSLVFECRLKDASLLKDHGNKLYGMGKINEALQAYRRGLHHVDFDEMQVEFELQDHHRDQLWQVKVPLLVNLGQVLVKQEGRQGPQPASESDESDDKKSQPTTKQIDVEDKKASQVEAVDTEAEETPPHPSESPAPLPEGAQGAVEILTSALKIQPDHARALYWRGRAHTMLNNYDEARDDLECAEDLCPSQSSRVALKQLKLLELNYKRKLRKKYLGIFSSKNKVSKQKHEAFKNNQKYLSLDKLKNSVRTNLNLIGVMAVLLGLIIASLWSKASQLYEDEF